MVSTIAHGLLVVPCGARMTPLNATHRLHLGHNCFGWFDRLVTASGHLNSAMVDRHARVREQDSGHG